MTDSAFDPQGRPLVPESSAEPTAERVPFVQPAVEELGRLSELTLIGGSVP